jgi:hypothetical protein
MADPSHDNNSSPRGFSIHTETIAQGKIRVKTKFWTDDIYLDTGIIKAVYLYDKTLKEFRKLGYKIDGEP